MKGGIHQAWVITPGLGDVQAVKMAWPLGRQPKLNLGSRRPGQGFRLIASAPHSRGWTSRLLASGCGGW